MLGITTQQLTFVTPNRTLDFGGNPVAFIFRFPDYAHPSSYAPQQLTSSFLSNEVWPPDCTYKSDFVTKVRSGGEVCSFEMINFNQVMSDGNCSRLADR